MKKPATILYAGSEEDSNIYYATKFFVPDPFLYLKINGRKVAVMSDLEIGRARDQAEVDRVVSMSALNRTLLDRGVRTPGPADQAAYLLKQAKVRSAEVPHNFPTALADALRKRGIRIRTKPDPFYDKRIIKTPGEIRAMEVAQRANEIAVKEGIQVIRKSRPSGKFLRYKGKILTAEYVRKVIHIALLELNCLGKNTIVASGNQGCDPHNRGSGPLRAHSSIIIDCFPRSLDNNYNADMTRTVCRGKPSQKLERIYETVREGQELGCKLIREGALGIDVHGPIHELFVRRGYKTEEKEGKMVGFFHGTGHGIGLDVHEPPRVAFNKDRLRAGMVVTSEPGLYYPGIGGVRIEDMVLVGKGRSRNLTKLKKQFVV